MKFSEDRIRELRDEVGCKLSNKRYLHTLGVEDMAVKIGKHCLPERIDELRVAALLHDISKEYSEAEQLLIAEKADISFTDDDMSSPPIWHSLTAAAVVKRDFVEFATPDILSAVKNHTVGSADISVFDEIILLADYIEEGRKYTNCIRVREDFLDAITAAKNQNESILALHEAVIASLNNNINEFISRGVGYHGRTKATLDSLISIKERLKMEIIKDLVNCDSGTLAREAVKILIEKKALNVSLFDVREKSSITDYYVNATGRSSTQVAALADDVDAMLAERGRGALRMEGKRGNGWILVDFGDVIINVFDRESREFYNLDRHFPEESRVDIADLVAEVDKKLEIKKED